MPRRDMIGALIDSAVLVESIDSSTTDAVIDEVLRALVAEGRLRKGSLAAIRKNIAEREIKGSTGIGNGVAVPHVKTDSVETSVFALGRSSAGVEWNAIDGRPVHLVFLILAPKSATEEHLAMLRWISTMARDGDFRRFARAAESADELRDLLREMAED